MPNLLKLTLILLPLVILGIAQMAFAFAKRKRIPTKFAVIFFISGLVTLVFAAALFYVGVTTLSS